ncbi:MAG TPA: YdcF family protein [Gemmatimonadaceae bacterium]
MTSDRRLLDPHTSTLAALGGSCALLAWLSFGVLTDVVKVPVLLYPLAVVATLCGALLALTRAARIVWAGTAIAVAAVSVVTLTPFVTTLLPTRRLVRSDTLSRDSFGAVIVLSGGITADSLLTSEALDRLLTGLALMRDGVAPVLVVTQPRRPDDGATAAPDQARLRSLVARPFPMLTVDSVRTTHDEAVRAWRLLAPRGATRVAVVTSPLHTARACATFEHVGFIVTCVPAISRAYSIDHAESGQDRLALFRAWAYERAAWTEYRARGWIEGPPTR